MHWFVLILAGLFEIAWAVGMKYTHGFTKLWPSVFTIVTMAFSVYFLSIAIKHIPVGTAYAVWTGIGVIGTSVAGILLWGESTQIIRLIFIFLIIIGIVGLKIFT